MVKTFYIKHLNAKEVLQRVHKLGVLDYSINWGVDVDERLNALTFHLTYTGGGGSEEKEVEVMKELEAFIKSVDLESPPKN